MTYAEFVLEQEAKRRQYILEAERKANMAYNQGLWDSVKYNPFKWHVFVLFMRPIK